VALYSTQLSVLIGSPDNHKDQRPKPTRQTGGGRFRLPLWDWETNSQPFLPKRCVRGSIRSVRVCWPSWRPRHARTISRRCRFVNQTRCSSGSVASTARRHNRRFLNGCGGKTGGGTQHHTSCSPRLCVNPSFCASRRRCFPPCVESKGYPVWSDTPSISWPKNRRKQRLPMIGIFKAKEAIHSVYCIDATLVARRPGPDPVNTHNDVYTFSGSITSVSLS
jgi:hypothetical protein